MALIFERIQTDGIAALSYLVGDDSEGIAAVFDPRPDVECYLELVREMPRKATLIARATDSEGRTQPTERDEDRRSYIVNHLLPIEVDVRSSLRLNSIPTESKSHTNRTMKKESRTRQSKESASNKQPVDLREYPLARDSRGSAAREEIRAQTPRVSAPRQSRRPVERSK